MHWIYLISFYVLQSLIVCDPGASNSVPHIGKRFSLVPSFTSGFLPQGYPKSLRERIGKREDTEGSRDITLAHYRPSWAFGKRADDDLDKRSPWTGAWANIVWRPDMKSVAGKRFDSIRGGRSFISKPWDNFIRTPQVSDWWLASCQQVINNCLQGFRFNDDGGDWFARGMLQKRARNYVSGFNSVPMMGKRDEEYVQQSDDDVEYLEESV